MDQFLLEILNLKFQCFLKPGQTFEILHELQQFTLIFDIECDLCDMSMGSPYDLCNLNLV